MQHVKSLDSLRGLAALSVFFYHIFLINHELASLYKPWYFFMTGHEAVIWFFVLSGYVLTLSYQKHHLTYGSYVVCRILRIYPAYYFSVFLLLVYFIILKPNPIPEYTLWFNSIFPAFKLSLQNWLNAVTLIIPSDYLFNSVAWSLVYEMIISLLFLPLLIKYYRYYKVFIILYVIIVILRKIFRSHDYTGTYFIQVIYYASFFYIGVCLCNNKDRVTSFAKLRYAPLYLVFYANAFVFFHRVIFSFEVVNDLLAAFGASGFIILAVHNNLIKNLLSRSIFHFYGKISYSFYLLHMGIINLLIYSLKDHYSLLYLKFMMFIVVTIISYLSYRYIEIPMIQLGKKLTR